MYQENERRLAAAAAAQEAEEREATARRHVKRAPYKPGGLSAEEKAARLADMQSNALINDAERESRLRRAADEGATEGAPLQLQGPGAIPCLLPLCSIYCSAIASGVHA